MHSMSARFGDISSAIAKHDSVFACLASEWNLQVPDEPTKRRGQGERSYKVRICTLFSISHKIQPGLTHQRHRFHGAAEEHIHAWRPSVKLEKSRTVAKGKLYQSCMDRAFRL